MLATLLRPDDGLEKFTLAEAARKALKNFSGGMRRRLDLVAAGLIARQIGRPTGSR